MADTTVTPNEDTTPEPTAESEARSHFAKAIEEAKAGAQALGKEAQDRAGEYREKLNQTKDDWASKGREKSGEAKDMASDYANLGKSKASQAISGAAKLVEDNAATLDEKVGVKYGNYARNAAQSMQDAAVRLDEKSFEELGEDAKQFVREKPALAVGIAAAAGFMLARIFRRR